MGVRRPARVRARGQGLLGAAAIALAATGGLVVLPSPGNAQATTTTQPPTVLVSSSTAGVPGNRAADRPQISGNGRYITFDSASTNLMPGVTTWGLRVYRKDLTTGQLDLVSVSDAGTPTGEWSSFTWPDQTGNLVAFVSDATDLDRVRTTTRSVYLRNFVTGDTELISIGIDGKAANAPSSRPMLSRNGRFVAFSSSGSNLTAAGGNGQNQVYVRDRLLQTTTLVSVATDGGLGNAQSYRAMVSDDGRRVAWAASASNLVAGKQINGESIFLRDLTTGVTTRASFRPSTGAPMGGSRPYLSPDGALVVYNTYSAVLPDDTNGVSDVYTYDRTTGSVVRESIAVSGGDGSDEALRGFVTDDHRFFVFNSFSGNLVTDDQNAYGDVFMRDRTSGMSMLVSRSSAGSGSDGQSFRPVPSADGRMVTFLSEARNLVPGDASSGYQVYATDLGALMGAATDTTAPVVTVTAPTSAQRIDGDTVTVTGTITDEVAADAAGVRIRDTATGLWLTAAGGWSADPSAIPATLSAVGTTSATWQVAVTLPSGSYAVDAGGLDSAGNAATPTASVPFTVADIPPDTTAPVVEVASPTASQRMTSTSVTLTGTATDDRALASAWVQVRDNTGNLWLRADGTWGAGARRVPVSVSGTSWSLPLALPDGSYGFEIQAQDTAGNLSAKPWRSFTVDSRVPDTTAPTVTPLTPSAGSTVGSSVVLSGGATDDVGVAQVFVQVRDNATNLWLRADGSWAAGAKRIPATVLLPGSRLSGWTSVLSLPAGSYGFDVQSVDAAGNVSTKPFTKFTVVGP